MEALVADSARYDVFRLMDSALNGQPAAAIAIMLQPGANALDVAAAVKKRMDELATTFPSGVEWTPAFDTTTFVRISIWEVVKTLIEAVVLVFLVMLVFLQNIRATIIPTLVIPVALLGTFLGLSMFGFTINQLTLFAMVLAIGIVVDDAIVVIENVERIMAEEHLPPREATLKAMGQITGAVVAITVVLAAVFIPSALQGGASGEIYKQFAITIAIAMGFSAFLALGFTPALCASFLKQHEPQSSKHHNPIFRTFNALYERVAGTYVGHITSAVRHAPRWMMLFVVLAALAGYLYTRLPTGFVPEEDQGYALAIVQLPPGASLQRTMAVMDQVRETLGGTLDPATGERTGGVEGFEHILQVSGFSFIGQGENVGMAFIKLQDWSKRKVSINQFIGAANQALYMGVKDARIFVINLPTIQGLGEFGGFDMYLQDLTGQGRNALSQAMGQTLGLAGQKQDLLVGVRPNTMESAPQLKLSVDRVQAQTMGLSVQDVYNAVQLMLAPIYVNDYFADGRVKRVNIRADAPFRTGPESFARFYTPAPGVGLDGQPAMVPLSNVVSYEWGSAPPALDRYNGYSAVQIVGNPMPGRSSGEAMAAMESIVNEQLPDGFGLEWSGMSYQEILAGNTAAILLALSVVVVFLCLAALYESWSIPVAVLLVVPMGILGAVVLTDLRGLNNDLFFKIGMITVIGLASKNAILIIEFAVQQLQHGKTLAEATIEGARLRFRPILMTSFAFIMGVTPMAISTGAGSNARHALGTGVIGGMLFATFLGLLLIPVFFVVVRRMLGDKLHAPSPSHHIRHE